MSIKPSKKDRGIMISNVLKQYTMNREFVKYLGIPLGSRKIAKKKFIDAKISKIYEELDKCELGGLAINQQVKVIRSFICNKLYFIFANMEVGSSYLDNLDRRIRKVINHFVGGQSIQKSYLYASAKFGGLGLPCMRDEYAAYKVSHIANMLSSGEGKRILKGSINLQNKIPENQDLIKSLDKALDHLQLEWSDWKDFKNHSNDTDTWNFSDNEKSGQLQFNFKDLRSGSEIKGLLSNIHKSIIVHSKIPYNYDNFTKFNTRPLLGCLESGISNFYFRECKAPLADGMARF
jgi:hypothetical protein